MSTAEIIRAWKDPEYRSTLSVVPTHPAGLIELPDPDLGGSAATRDRSLRIERAYASAHSGAEVCISNPLCQTLSTHGKCCK